MSVWTVPLLHCIGCHQGVCTGTCLAAHRDRYCCHNPSCIFHAPFPAPPEGPSGRGTARQQPATTSRTAEQETAGAATPPADEATEAGDSPPPAGSTPGDSRMAAPTTTPAPTRDAAAPGADAPSSVRADRQPTSPARFTIEEYEAQARLLAQFQRPQDRRPQEGQQGGGTGGDNRNSGGARPGITIRIKFR